MQTSGLLMFTLVVHFNTCDAVCCCLFDNSEYRPVFEIVQFLVDFLDFFFTQSSPPDRTFVDGAGNGWCLMGATSNFWHLTRQTKLAFQHFLQPNGKGPPHWLHASFPNVSVPPNKHTTCARCHQMHQIVMWSSAKNNCLDCYLVDWTGLFSTHALQPFFVSPVGWWTISNTEQRIL